MSSVLFQTPPKGWAIINHALPRNHIDRRLRLTADNKNALEQIRRAKELPNVEIRYYFKSFTMDDLHPQFEAVFTELPNGLIQDFHTHAGTCQEITTVVSGRLLYIEHPHLTTQELADFMQNQREACFTGDSILKTGSMHISDPNSRHTLMSLADSAFWTWKLPPLDPRQGPFRSNRVAS